MILFLDTSSLVKLYLTEPGTGSVRSLVVDSEAVAVSRVAYPEMVAAATRRHREGDLAVADLDDILAGFDEDWDRLAVVEIDERAAGRLAKTHGLRGLDAIHLAAALELAGVINGPGAVVKSTTAPVAAAHCSEGPPDSLVFSTYDGRLRAAAVAAGLWVSPGLSPP